MKTFYDEFCKAMYFFVLGILISPFFNLYDIGFRSLGSGCYRFATCDVLPDPVFYAPHGSGTASKDAALRDAAPVPGSIVMRVTGYCPCSKCCGKYSDGFTANGHKIQPGDKFVAAPKHIPFGTMLSVPGYGVVPVLDRGGAITVSRLDVFFESHSDALKWGVQNLEITVVEK